MKKKFFVVLLALVAVFCLSLGISACAGGGGPEAETPSTPSTPSTPDDEGGEEDKEKDDEEKQKEEAAKSLAEAVERLDTFLGRIGENYCYTAAGTQYELASDVLKVTKGETAVYYTRDEKEHYIIAQNGEIWERDFCNEISVWETAENCLSVFENVEWTAFAEGELRAEGIQLRFGNDAVSWVKDGADYALSDVGEVEIALPAYKDLAQYVYETVDGVRKYNIPTLVHALEETLKENDLLTQVNYNVKSQLYKITHINSNNGLKFGACYLFDSMEYKTYRMFTIDDSKFYNDKLTINELKIMMVNQRLISSKFKAETPEISTIENDPEFQTMAENVLVKLAQDGCQGQSINNKADPLPEYENAKILFAYFTKDRGLGFAFDMGLIRCFDCMFIVKTKEGKIEELFATVSVAYSGKDENGHYYYLEELDTNNVLILKLESEEIDSENAKLYAEIDPAPDSAALPVTLFYEEKCR